MTFKGMLKILINDYRKQHEGKMLTLVEELMKTQRELREVKEQLQTLQVNDKITQLSQNNDDVPVPTISLYVQYHGFFKQLHNIRQTMTIEELLIYIRQLTGIPINRPIRLRILSEDGLTTVCFLDKKSHRTLQSYDAWLQPRMILSIEDNGNDTDQENNFNRSERKTNSSDQTRSFDESDV